jgi:esterase/lipase
VNVIGFSMGGVIARAMMKHLLSHKEKFNLLLTLASPHLGVKELDSCLVRTGLLYMRRIAKIESIQDLNVERNTDNSRFLVDLASCDSINCFKSVVLVGSK